MSLSVEMERIYMVRSFTHVSRWGQKINFFHKSLKVILLSFLTIFDETEVEIWCLKTNSELKTIRFLIFLKIGFVSFLMCTVVFKTEVIIFKSEQRILSFFLVAWATLIWALGDEFKTRNGAHLYTTYGLTWGEKIIFFISD